MLVTIFPFTIILDSFSVRRPLNPMAIIVAIFPFSNIEDIPFITIRSTIAFCFTI